MLSEAWPRRTMLRGLIALAGITAVSLQALAAQDASHALGEPIAWQVVEDMESGEISGVILGPRGEGLEGVQVWVPNLKLGGLSDEEGRFTFPAPPPGEWLFSLELIGFEPVREVITVPANASVWIAAVMARQVAICTNACVGTSCLDLGIRVVDASTRRRPTASIRLRVEFEDSVHESTTPYDPDSQVAAAAWVGLGRSIETIGWHSLELSADGYETWIDRVWLEQIPRCHGHLLGRDHEVELKPIG